MLKKGIKLDVPSFLAMAFAVIANYYTIDFSSDQSVSNHMILNEQNFFRLTRLDPSNVRKFFKNLVLSEKDLQQIRDEDINSPDYFYNFSILRRKPLYPLADGIYIPLYFPFYRWRTTEGLYWDIVFTYRDHYDVSNAFGLYFERYMQALYKKVFPHREGIAKRLWIEPKNEPNAPAADMVIEYSNAFVFMEIKGSRFKHLDSMVRGDMSAIKDDLRKLVLEPAQQLDKAIEYFKAGKLSLNGRTWNREPIYPVVITYTTLPTIDPVWSELLKQVSDNGFLQKPYVKELVALDAGEATILAGVAGQGATLTEILEKKITSDYRGIPFKNFALREYSNLGSTKDLLNTDWELFLFAAKELFNFQ